MSRDRRKISQENELSQPDPSHPPSLVHPISSHRAAITDSRVSLSSVYHHPSSTTASLPVSRTCCPRLPSYTGLVLPPLVFLLVGILAEPPLITQERTCTIRQTRPRRQEQEPIGQARRFATATPAHTHTRHMPSAHAGADDYLP